jgi:hypothetical protein
MPVVPIIAGLGAAWLGGSAVLAVGSAIATGTLAAVGAGAIFTAIATVGAVVGAVGAVTKSKFLMKAGMVMGIVGGVGALASAAGAFGANGGSLFSTEAVAAATAKQTALKAAAEGAATATSAGATTAAAANEGSLLAGAKSVTGVTAGGVKEIDAVKALMGTVPEVQVANIAPAAGATTSAASAASKRPLWDAVANPEDASIFGELLPAVDGTTKATADTGFWAYAKSYGGGQAIGGTIQGVAAFLGGAFDEKAAAEAAYYDAQAAENRRHTANMQGDLPILPRREFKPSTPVVTGAPAPTTPGASASGVTGAPAAMPTSGVTGMINQPQPMTTGVPMA